MTKQSNDSPALAEPAATSVTDRIRLIVESLPGNHAKWVEGDDLSFEEVQARLKTWTIHLLQELAAAPSKGMELAEKVKVTRTAWLEQHGVPISHEFAEFAEAVGNLCNFVAGAAPSSVQARTIPERDQLFEARVSSPSSALSAPTATGIFTLFAEAIRQVLVVVYDIGNRMTANGEALPAGVSLCSGRNKRSIVRRGF